MESIAAHYIHSAKKIIKPVSIFAPFAQFNKTVELRIRVLIANRVLFYSIYG